MALVWKENPQLADQLLEELANDIDRDLPIPTVTELIYCLTKGWFDRKNPIPRVPKTTCQFAIGVGLGEVLLKGLRTEVAGNLEGIHYHIDFLMPEPDSRLGELKSTRYSVNKPPEQWSTGWHKQLLAYMKARGVLEAVYSALFVIPAEFKTWEVTAEQADVDFNWTWLQARRAVYMNHIHTHTLPTPFAWNEKWECGGCQYRTLCDAEVALVNQDMGEGGVDQDRARYEAMEEEVHSKERTIAEESA
jgi:CRISPR/Cas system-associated exonuclease Cas4 (RecB family)